MPETHPGASVDPVTNPTAQNTLLSCHIYTESFCLRCGSSLGGVLISKVLPNRQTFLKCPLCANQACTLDQFLNLNVRMNHMGFY